MESNVITLRRERPALQPLDLRASVDAILEAASSLMREDLVILAYQGDIATHLPVLWVKDCSRLRNLARVGVASYDRTGHADDGPYRVGVFQRCGVTVQWMERITPCAA